MLHSWANPDGTQKIEDTGPMTKKRMETIDDEITDGALDFIERQAKADKPFFCWWNSTRMHVWTHLKAESKGKTGLGVMPMAWWSTTVTSDNSSPNSMNWASPTTPSSCTRPTTAPKK